MDIPKVSVIIATYNRAHLLPQLLTQWEKIDAASKYSFELIFSDDGSSDSTLELLRNYEKIPLVVLENKHHGAAQARNHAVEVARGELLIFTGDDIFPEENFVNKHWEYYEKHGSRMATLGRIEWRPGIEKTYLMNHITEVGCEQFGFVALPKFAKVDFRHFYTSNISVSSSAVKKLGKTFDLAFTKCNFEDIELGYRLEKQGTGIFYAPDILVYHDHVYSDVDKFCNRQYTAGEMLAIFKKVQPNLSAAEIGLDLDDFKRSLLVYSKKKYPDFFAMFVFLILAILKPFTRLCEIYLKKNDTRIVRKFCSLIYSSLFTYSLYAGLTEGVGPEIPKRTRIFFALRFSHYRLFVNMMKKIKRKINLTINRIYGKPGFSFNPAPIWVQVDILDKKIIKTYREICKPFLPAIIVSQETCPMPSAYRCYKYNPGKDADAMSEYAFSNALFCLARHDLDFIILSGGLEEWPILRGVSINSSLIFSSGYLTVENFIKNHKACVGKFIRLKSRAVETEKINLAKYFPKMKRHRGFIYQGMAREKGVVVFDVEPKSKNKKPIVFVFPSFMAVGGVERNTIEVIKKLNDKYDFIVVTWENHNEEVGSLFHQLDGNCLAYFDFAQISKSGYYLENLSALKNAYNPEIVWVPNSNQWYFHNLVEIRKIFSEAVMVAQDVYDTEKGWIAWYDRPGVNQYDAYIAINEKIKNKFIQSYKISKDKIHLIYPAINTNGIISVNSGNFDKKSVLLKYKLNPNVKNFAFIGRLTDQKQPLEFIHLAKKITEKRKDINFVMVGDGLLHESVDELIKKSDMGDRFIRIPFIESIYDFTKAVDGLVITSLYEGLPIVAVEAMCVGTPIVTTDVGDLPLFVRKYDIGVVADGYSSAEIENAFEIFLAKLEYFKKRVELFMEENTSFFSSERAAALTAKSFNVERNIIKCHGSDFEENIEINNPLVSIIIPSYNHDKYIKEAVESVLNQTYENIELIVIDDGSSDHSLKYLESVKDLRYKLVKQANQGAHNAINNGLKMARGEFLAILNSDDVYHPDRVRQAVYEMLKDHKIEFVASWIECVDNSGKSLGVKRGWDNMHPWTLKESDLANYIPNEFMVNLIKSNFISTTSNMIFRRAVYDETGGMQNLRFVHDWDFALRVAKKHTCRLLKKPLLQYRLHDANTIKSNRLHMLFEICWIYAVNLRHFSENISSHNEISIKMTKILESINLQGNEQCMWAIYDFIDKKQKMGIKSPEKMFLDNKDLRETYFKYIKV